MKERNKSRKSLFQISKVLWHLDIFRRSFRELTGHTCMVESCIFCALKELFSQLQFSHESALPPDALRRALAESFFDQQRFQLGFMDDAAECFENILLRIHYHLAENEAEDLCSAKHCIPHIKFAMTLVEQSVCGACGATSEPLPFTQMVHYVSASALISQSKQTLEGSPDDLFGRLLKRAGGMGDIRDCPSACGAKIQIRRSLTNMPEVVSVGIVWDSERPSLQQIMSLLEILRTSLRLSDVFHTPSPSPKAHDLVGIVTYYGKHYSTFFFHTKLKIWIYFDDANVREVGPKWEQVVDKCCRGRYQPLLLLFAVPDGSPVDTTNAPTGINLSPRLSQTTATPAGVGATPCINPARRSLTPSPEKPPLSTHNQRRALTPNPEHSSIQRTLVLNDYQNLSIFQAEGGLPNRPWRTDLVRRDSGNWSGDRNSASSSSSTSLENPYQYIIGRMQQRTCVLTRSPSSNKGGESSSGGSQCDGGYDSYSLSSTDSLPLQQNLKHTLQLAKIPEGHQSPVTNGAMKVHKPMEHADCERLCKEADVLLYQSQITDDLQSALSFANAAVDKARQAMDAPYSNPASASAARMKHNACLMQARSIHKRIEDSTGSRHAEGRHSREGSGSGSRGNHSRQNSKDKGNHSRQNSKELLPNIPGPVEKTQDSVPVKASEKNIEIYATLPKTRKGLLSRAAKVTNVVEDEEYMMYDRPGRSLGRSKLQGNKKEEKRARSEERSNKSPKEKEVLSNQLSKEAKKQFNKNEDGKQGKKQHKIRRKLLMGGLIKRKNRSLPDLRDDEVVAKGASKDDSSIGGKVEKQTSLSGYLSEGHLEYSGNPNLEKSKLMRKSFHGSKILQLTKVPPPPPLRTTSQLSKTDRPQYPLPNEVNARVNETWNQEPQSLPPMNHYCDSSNSVVNYAVGGYLLQPCNTKLVTTAQVHQVSSPVFNDDGDGYVDDDDDDDFQLPPYPSPHNSANHSRQASEEFPPPPPECQPETTSSLLEQLQLKRQQILYNNKSKDSVDSVDGNKSSGDTWLKELQAKQASLKGKAANSTDNNKSLPNFDKIEKNKDFNESLNVSSEQTSVKDLKSRFEKISVKGIDKPLKMSGDSSHRTVTDAIFPLTNNVQKADSLGVITSAAVKEVNKPKPLPPGNEIKGVLCSGTEKRTKKKSVTFCEQVVLVATAEEDKVESYIPNPILERVLRSVLHKDSSQEVREITVQSVVPLKRNDSGNYGQCGKRIQNENSSAENKNDVPLNSSPCTTEKQSDMVNGNKNSPCPQIHMKAQPSPVLNRQPMRVQSSPVPIPPVNTISSQPSSQEDDSHSVSPSPYPVPESMPNIQRTQYYSGCNPGFIHDSFVNNQFEGMHNGLPRENYCQSQVTHHIENSSYIRISQCENPNNNCSTGNISHNGRPPLTPAQNSSHPPHQSMTVSPIVGGGMGNQSMTNGGNPNCQDGHTQNMNAAYINRNYQQNSLHRPPSSGSMNNCYQMPPMSLPYTQQMMQQSHMVQRQAVNGQMVSTAPMSSSHQRSVPQGALQQALSLRQRVASPNHLALQNTKMISGESHSNGEIHHYTQSQVNAMSNGMHSGVPSVRPSEHSVYQHVPGPLNQASMSRSLSNLHQQNGNGQANIVYHQAQNVPMASKANNQGVCSPYSTPPTSVPNTIPPSNRSCYMSVPQKKMSEEVKRPRPQGVYQQDMPDSITRDGAIQRQDIYQRVPHPHEMTSPHLSPAPTHTSPYMSLPQQANHQMTNGHQPNMPNVYMNGHPPKFSPYQHPPPPRQDAKSASPAPHRTASCNLCRKKPVSPPAIYCPDCDFYMSRFKPKT